MESHEHERPLPHGPNHEADKGTAGEPRPERLTPPLIALTLLGGCLGLGLRALLQFAMPDGSTFPKTTFAINLTGALALAVDLQEVCPGVRAAHPDVPRTPAVIAIVTGVLGPDPPEVPDDACRS